MGSKLRIDPLTRRKTAMKNLEVRQNTMLRTEHNIITTSEMNEQFEEESPKKCRNKRTSSVSSLTDLKKARINETSVENEAMDITINFQDNRHLPGTSPTILEPEINTTPVLQTLITANQTLQKEMDLDETVECLGNSANDEKETHGLNYNLSASLQEAMFIASDTTEIMENTQVAVVSHINNETSVTPINEIDDVSNFDENEDNLNRQKCSIDCDSNNKSHKEIDVGAISIMDNLEDKLDEEIGSLRRENENSNGDSNNNLQNNTYNIIHEKITDSTGQTDDREESFNVLSESNLDLSIGFNDVNELERNLTDVFHGIVSPSININASTSAENNEKSEETTRIRQHRKSRKVFKNSCFDFISDNEDFSPGSSDHWSPYESEVSESENIAEKKRKNKSKKKKSTERTQQEAINEKVISRLKVHRKNKRKSHSESKNAGKAYENRTGKVKEAKSMKQNPCVPGICARKCYEISDERRQSIFDHYWTLNYQRQRDWISCHSKLTDVRRKKTKLDVSRRQKTVEYFINEGEGQRKVCQKFLINTLDVSQKLLQYTTNHAEDGMALSDKRSFNGILKYSEDAKKFARTFIDKLPAVSSHYCRRDSQKLYLPQDLKNISNLYRLYAEECQLGSIERISEKMFRQIFTDEYNLSFHVPKKDKCVQCVKSENGNDLTTIEREQLHDHLEEKKASYNRFKIHQTLQCEDTVVTSFDLQKVLNTPYGESMLLYYSRKYSMYNLTFYESQTQNGFCYLWGECDAKRGSNEVATCIIKYLKDVDEREKIKKVLFYCDACCGQNKNKVVLTAIHNFLCTSKNIRVVQINFLLPGHSYMPVDSMHAVIEREVKRLIVWSPSQWPTYIEAARKKPFPYKVETLEYCDIMDWNKLSAKAFQGDPIKEFRKIRVVTMKKKNLKVIEIKYSMKDEAETKEVEIFQSPASKKGKGRGKNKAPKTATTSSLCVESNNYDNISLEPLYRQKQTISQAKYNDLKKLCTSGTIPKRFHSEYLNLSTSVQTRDNLPETDEEDEEL